MTPVRRGTIVVCFVLFNIVARGGGFVKLSIAALLYVYRALSGAFSESVSCMLI